MILKALYKFLKRTLPKILKRVLGSNSRVWGLVRAWAESKALHLKVFLRLSKVAIKLPFYVGLVSLCLNHAKDIAHKSLTGNHVRFLALFSIGIISVEMFSIIENMLDVVYEHYEEFRNDKELAPILLWVWATAFAVFIHGCLIYVLSSFRP